jgi:hypothetical protein
MGDDLQDSAKRLDWGSVIATPALHAPARSVRKVRCKVRGDHLYDSFATRKAHFSITALFSAIGILANCC